MTTPALEPQPENDLRSVATLLLDRLLHEPDQLRDSLLRQLVARDAAADAERELKRRRLMLALDVSQEQTPDGKKAYANETARAARVEELLNADTTTARLQERLEHTTRRAAQLGVEVEHHRSRIDAARAAARIIGRGQ